MHGDTGSVRRLVSTGKVIPGPVERPLRHRVPRLLEECCCGQGMHNLGSRSNSEAHPCYLGGEGEGEGEVAARDVGVNGRGGASVMLKMGWQNGGEGVDVKEG